MQAELKIRELLKWNEDHPSLEHAGEKLRNLQLILTILRDTKLPVTKLFWVTINPRSGTGLEVLQDRMDRCVRTSMFSKYYYVYEQRGETEEDCGRGIHIHMVVLTTYSPSHLKSFLWRAFKDVLGSRRHLDIRKYPVSYLEEKVDYISGNKWDPEKDSKVDIDRVFRSKNNLDPYYTNATGSTVQVYSCETTACATVESCEKDQDEQED